MRARWTLNRSRMSKHRNCGFPSVEILLREWKRSTQRRVVLLTHIYTSLTPRAQIGKYGDLAQSGPGCFSTSLGSTNSRRCSLVPKCLWQLELAGQLWIGRRQCNPGNCGEGQVSWGTGGKVAVSAAIGNWSQILKKITPSGNCCRFLQINPPHICKSKYFWQLCLN